MSLICIYGDSNGAGSWGQLDSKTNIIYGKYPERVVDFLYDDTQKRQKAKYAITSPGLQSHFSKSNMHCVNYSHGGGSNIQNLKTLLESLYYGGTGHSRVLNPDVIVFFITAPLRDLYAYEHQSRYGEKVREIVKYPHSSIEELGSTLLKYSLDILQEISEHTGIPVITVDGWGKISTVKTNYSFFYSEETWWESYFDSSIPLVTSLRTFEKLDLIVKDKEIWNSSIRESYLHKYEHIANYMKSRKNNTFPDAGHLYSLAYSKLADILLPVIHKIV